LNNSVRLNFAFYGQRLFKFLFIYLLFLFIYLFIYIILFMNH